MKRALFAVASLFAAGCSAPSRPDAGGDAGSIDEEVIFKVNGKAVMHPVAVSLLADAGLSNSVAGYYARVEEPFLVATKAGGIFSTQVLDATGAFSAMNISTTEVSLGVAGGIFDLPDGGADKLVRSATTIFDVALQGGKPTGDIANAKAYVVPRALHDRLTAAVTEAKIRMLTGNNNKGSLIEAGFILGRVIDASGAPVAGVTVAPIPASYANGFFYPTADLSALGTATSSNGLFVYVHNGGDVATFRFGITGKSEYKTRNAGAAKDACLVLDVFPGLTAP